MAYGALRSPFPQAELGCISRRGGSGETATLHAEPREPRPKKLALLPTLCYTAYGIRYLAPVAQWIERMPPKHEAARSSRVRRTPYYQRWRPPNGRHLCRFPGKRVTHRQRRPKASPQRIPSQSTWATVWRLGSMYVAGARLLAGLGDPGLGSALRPGGLAGPAALARARIQADAPPLLHLCTSTRPSLWLATDAPH